MFSQSKIQFNPNKIHSIPKTRRIEQIFISEFGEYEQQTTWIIKNVELWGDSKYEWGVKIDGIGIFLFFLIKNLKF